MTPLLDIQRELEEYFAKKYTKKYIEFGGYFYFKGLVSFHPTKGDTGPFLYHKSPMEKYFISGKYKELNDPKLDYYWNTIKTKRLWRNFIIIIILVILFLAGH